MEIIKAIIFGIVQGITEWLPISSTGHLLLVDEFLKLDVFANTLQNAEFVNMFMVVIQFGSILAVCLLYFRKLNPFDSQKSSVQKRDTLSLWSKVIVGCIPAGIIGILFDDIIDSYLRGSLCIALMLIVYGIFFIIIENKDKKVRISNFSEMSYKDALAIGFFQVLALIPGTSRSGATILGAVLLGTSRTVAAEFSFFLAVPVMAGASLLKLIKMFASGLVMSGFAWMILAIGTIVSFAVSVVAIKFMMNYIRTHDFKAFGYYRIVLGFVIIVVMLMGVL